MMKRFWTTLITLICGCFVILQADEVRVTLKNGTVFTGELKEFVATDHITVVIAGIESVVPISEVASVEKPNAQQEFPIQKYNFGDSNLQYGKYSITDTKNYPESFTLKIGDQELTMVLVRGGWFNMGYDGRHSLSWDSEPVHRVTLSSYYVSTQYLNCHVAEVLLNKEKISKSVKPYNCRYRKNAEKLIEEISTLSGAPYRMLTEAEWEYAALMPFARTIFNNNKNVEWCSDFFEKYSSADQMNPQGPNSGKNHVLRSYSSDNEKWKRSQGSGKKDWAPDAFIRIAIGADCAPASDVVSIEIENSAEQEQPAPEVITDIQPVYENYEITDTKQYPDSFILNVGNQELTMVLVRGGWFNMGNDGHDSIMHKVTLSSFYISKQLHKVKYKKNADDLLQNLVNSTKLPYRLPTEAEWEYAALMPFAESIFSEDNLKEWCSDFWGPYGVGEDINPQGPKHGKSHVLRAYSRNKKKTQRSQGIFELGEETTKNNAYMRVVISADCVTF